MHILKEQSYHSPFATTWPVNYWNDELFGQGTVLNISPLGCRVAGTMTVTEGARLKLWMSPPHKEDQLCVEEARVLWVNNYEFGVEFRQLAAIDQRELATFLENAEHCQTLREGLPSS